jgi:hypothetical protein
MATEDMTYTTPLPRQTARYKTAARPRFLRRFRNFIKHSEWDEVILAQEEWIDKMFVGVILVASIYFVPPVLVMLFLG